MWVARFKVYQIGRCCVVNYFTKRSIAPGSLQASDGIHKVDGKKCHIFYDVHALRRTAIAELRLTRSRRLIPLNRLLSLDVLIPLRILSPCRGHKIRYSCQYLFHPFAIGGGVIHAAGTKNRTVAHALCPVTQNLLLLTNCSSLTPSTTQLPSGAP